MPTFLDRLRPHEAQREVLASASRFNVPSCGRRWGKTHLCRDLAIDAALQGHPVGWFAPTYKLLDEAWEEMGRALAPLERQLQDSKTERVMRFPTGGRVDYWSTDRSTEGRSSVGRGRKYKLVVYDEAAHAKHLKADWEQAIRPTLADLEGSAWFPSTPRGRTYYWRLWLKGQNGEEGWASWHLPTSTNPTIAASEIEAAQRDLPRDAFAQEYEAEFLADAANPFGISAIHACFADVPTMQPAVWGIDLAKSHDWTVACGLSPSGELVAFQRWQGDWRATRSRVAAMIGRTPALVDSTGVGDPIVEDLQAACPQCEGYKFTMTSKQQLFEGLALSLQNQRVRFCPDRHAVLVGELESFQYEYRPSGVRYTAPEGMHDDCVDALALAVRCLMTRPVAPSFYVGDETSDRNWFADAVDREEIWQ